MQSETLPQGVPLDWVPQERDLSDDSTEGVTYWSTSSGGGKARRLRQNRSAVWSRSATLADSGTLSDGSMRTPRILSRARHSPDWTTRLRGPGDGSGLDPSSGDGPGTPLQGSLLGSPLGWYPPGWPLRSGGNPMGYPPVRWDPGRRLRTLSDVSPEGVHETMMSLSW